MGEHDKARFTRCLVQTIKQNLIILAPRKRKSCICSSIENLLLERESASLHCSSIQKERAQK